MEYNATLIVPPVPDDDTELDRTLAALADYHPALAWPRPGETEVIITYPAANCRQAVTTAMAIATQAGLDVRAITVEETARFDKLSEEQEVPPLVSASQAASVLGISRQAVIQRIKVGTLHGIRVGDFWVLPKADLR